MRVGKSEIEDMIAKWNDFDWDASNAEQRTDFVNECFIVNTAIAQMLGMSALYILHDKNTVKTAGGMNGGIYITEYMANEARRMVDQARRERITEAEKQSTKLSAK